MDYRQYQFDDVKLPVSKNIHIALQDYIQKHGLPEQILLEVSDRIGEPVVLPEGMNIVKKSIRIPKNIVLIGSENTLMQD